MHSHIFLESFGYKTGVYMGPLVPDIIGNELNLVAALFIGIAFGFILEQAGFSTSKKLVGLFYGYDFTVLRVFFYRRRYCYDRRCCTGTFRPA